MNRALHYLFLFMVSVASAAAQSTPDSALSAKADSLYAVGDRAAAARLYAVLLERNPRNSRAVYRIAASERSGSEAAIAGFRQYIELEPDDVWGLIALGEALVDAGEPEAALEVYDTALDRAPAERDAALGRADVLLLMGRGDEAADFASRWLSTHTGDSAQFTRYLAGADSRAAENVPGGPAGPRIPPPARSARTTLAPAIGGSWDSDGNTVDRLSLTVRIPTTETTSLGAKVERISAGGAEGTAALDGAGVLFRWRPSRSTLLDVDAGAVRNESTGNGKGPAPRPAGRLRLRFEPGVDHFGGELRLQRTSVDASATLIDNRIMLEEGSASAHVPLAGAVRLQLSGAVGAMVEKNSRNMRWRIGGGPAFQVGDALSIGLSATHMAYDHYSRAGYFAPSLLQTIEASAYGEFESAGPFDISLDAGVGAQRAALESEPAGDWGPVVRGWASIVWPFAAGSSLSVEIEGYSATISPEVATAAEGWNYGSVLVSLSWGL